MYLDQGIHLGEEMEFVEINGRWVTMCHYPYTDERYPELCPVDNGSWLIHGHVHDEWQINGRQINVGVDVWDYTPVSIETIRSLIG